MLEKYSDLNSECSIPLKINYCDEYPRVTVLDGRQHSKLLQPILTKAKVWEYEKEWRMINRDSEGVIRFMEGTVDTLYLGTNISTQNRNTLLQRIKKSNKRIKVFQLFKSQYNFVLNFERVV